MSTAGNDGPKPSRRQQTDTTAALLAGSTQQSKVLEMQGRAAKGAVMLPIVIVLLAAGIALFSIGFTTTAEMTANALYICGVVLFLIGCILACGFFTLQPNEARVMVLFGNYKGSIKETGFYWANPFYSRALQTSINGTAGKSSKDDDDDLTVKTVKAKISLRQRTLNGPKLKVNDKNGNPIEIANVIVWRVVDTAKAVFDVDNYERYVSTQSETALRHVASLYAYDNNEDSEDDEQITLRSNIIDVSEALRRELSERLAPAGIAVEDARLTHLAYAPEIAQVMLRRQQAEAIIAARAKIVQGAVSMVDMAIKELDRDSVISLDDERKATMVSNLMVVLCADNDAQPVINAGSLYN
ncbi:MAG: SPFH domain-containing protein [Bifidobacteriaceae bacterium]|jgi:regulator of protease activity HflC (stomatin/prohibitin superfamily)|nr:SPFH domain-containing protein [Bifidobacteriaceae bacterium]MCI1978393.1 SPFH domain-containing protein [Bifidobacteriaceae bacterium]